MSGDERGVGLIELLVVLSLTTLALTMFGMAYSATLRTSGVSREIGNATDQARSALTELDRQVRFGYWVKQETSVCGSDCAIKVLTQDSAGSRECWIWAIDRTDGRLLTFHYPATASVTVPSLGSSGWHLAASSLDPLVAASWLRVTGSQVNTLLVSNFTRQPLYMAAAANLSIVAGNQAIAGNQAAVPISFQVSVRNQWAGAQYATECA